MTLISGDRVLSKDALFMVCLVILIWTLRSKAKEFGRFFCWTNGIYPELTWFVKSFQEPSRKSKVYYSNAAFNFSGSLNEINIWGQSSLQRCFIHGMSSDLDLDFEIQGKKIWQIFLLDNGIYPDLTWLSNHFKNQEGKGKFIIQNGKRALERTLRENLLSCRGISGPDSSI